MRQFLENVRIPELVEVVRYFRSLDTSEISV